MTIAELIERLSQYDPLTKVVWQEPYDDGAEMPIQTVEHHDNGEGDEVIILSM